MEIILSKTNLPDNVIDIVKAFYEPTNFLIMDVKIKFMFDPKEDGCIIKVIDPISKTDKFKRFIRKMDKADWSIDRKDRYVIHSCWGSDDASDIQYHKTYLCDLHFNGFLLCQISYTLMF